MFAELLGHVSAMQDPTNFSAWQGGRLEDNVSSVLEDVVMWLNPPLTTCSHMI